jgi:Ca2+-binding EF-hand superfamily protein
MLHPPFTGRGLRFPQRKFEVASMHIPALFLAILAPAAQPPASTPIFVTGHPWAPFISPMGEPFRAHSATDDTLADWFTRADRNHDGVLTADEMQADAERFFALLDTNHDGQIDPDELVRYEWQVAPEIQVMSRTRRAPGDPASAALQTDDEASGDGDTRHDRDWRRERREERYGSLGLGGALQGAARYALLNIPEPVAAADADFNRLISLAEFRAAALARFQLLDSAHKGRLSLAQLEALPHVPKLDKHHPKIDENAPDRRIGSPLPTGP